MRSCFPLLLLALATAGCSTTLDEPALMARAQGIHSRVLTLDTHKDISPTLALSKKTSDPAELLAWRKKTDPTFDGDNQVDFPKMRRGGYDCAFFIVYVGQGPLNGGGYVRARREAMLKFDAIDRMCRKYPEHIGLAATPDDVRRLHEEGKLVACIGIENGYPMGENLDLIAEFQRRGARYMSIAHNKHSQLGDSHTPAEPLHGGLSELGRKAIAEMNRVGIMVDISHASKQTMLQALEVSRAPVLASHSGCRALCDHTRNLDDEQLLALKKNGGVIQCVALGSFVKANTGRREAMQKIREECGLPGWSELYKLQQEGLTPEMQKRVDTYNERIKVEVDSRFLPANVSDFVDHICHAVDLIGIDHVGISSDFDGGGGVQGWQSAAETRHVTEELVRRGFTEEEIGKLWSGNTLRLWAEVQAVARTLDR